MARIIGKPKSVLLDKGPAPGPTLYAQPADDPLPLDPQNPAVLILSACRWMTTGGGQRPVQMAKALAGLGKHVIYSSHNDRPATTAEGVIITNHADIARNMPLLQKTLGTVWCCFPQLYEYAIQLRNWVRVLDLCDDWQAFQQAGLIGPEMWNLRQEKVACLDSHVVTHSAASLGLLAREHGAEVTRLLANAGPDAPLAGEDDRPEGLLEGKPNVVFVGCLWGNWMDWGAVKTMARKLAEVGGVLNIIGGMDSAQVKRDFPQADNIRYHGAKPYAEAMRYVAACDVGIIPFMDPVTNKKRVPICKAVDPVKYYDYIAAGLPVVATKNLGELQGRPYVTLAARDKLAEAVVEAARRKVPGYYVVDFCKKESWRARAEALLAMPNIPGIWF